MGLESATYVSQLNALNPVGATDPKSQGDDHLRLIKSVLQASFPNISGAMTVSHTRLNAIDATGFTGFAVPSVKVKATGAAGAGVATTAHRSDAQLLLDLADSYAWTGTHSFSLSITFSGTTYTFSNAQPNIYLVETGAAANAKRWREVASGGSLVWQSEDDAITVNRTWLQINRSGVAIASIAMGNTTDNPTYTFNSSGAFSASNFHTSQLNYDAGTAGFMEIVNRSAGALGLKIYLGAAGSAPLVTFDATGHSLLIDGAVGAPVYSYFLDSDTGGYRIGSGNIGWASDGTLVFQIIAAASGGAKVADFGGTQQTVGFREIPQNIQAANYTCVLADSGKHIYHASGAGAGDVYTIPANASVAFAIGTAITFINSDSNSITIAITTDTMTLAGTTTTGTRTLAQNGVATAIKVTATSWIISGTGIS
jgi:hypothetical protein